MDTQMLMSLAIGLGLAAACGFRVFVPPLLMSLAARSGYLGLSESFEWMASTPALVIFASATVLEIGAYYVPWLDHLLDLVAAPSAVVAGIVATASQTGDLHPLLGWSLAVVGGGGTAGAIQSVTTLSRGFSTMASGGFANPLLATIEAGAAVFCSILAILVPLAASFALLLLGFYATRYFFLHRRTVAT